MLEEAAACRKVKTKYIFAAPVSPNKTTKKRKNIFKKNKNIKMESCSMTQN